VAKPNHVFSNIIAVRASCLQETPCFSDARQVFQGRSSEYWNEKSTRALAPKFARLN
jgi:hypothetical protein